MIFSCAHCKHIFTTKNGMQRHIKNNCKIIKSACSLNITHDDAKKKCDNKKSKINENCCYHCNKKFSDRRSVYRHIKSSCKIVKNDKVEKNEKQKICDELNQLREENMKMRLELEMQKLNVVNDNITNINTGVINNGTINNTGFVNNVNNSINIIFSFGKEDISKIDSAEMNKAFKNGFNSTVELTDAIHFNPKYPEYHNVYIPSMKDKYGMVYKEGKWELMNKQELINKLYDNKKDYIEENMKSFYNTITKSQQNALKRWLLVEDDDDKIVDIKERMKLLLYNKRHIPIASKNCKLKLRNE